MLSVVSNAKNACITLVLAGLCLGGLRAPAQNTPPTEPLQLSGLVGGGVSGESQDGTRTVGEDVGITANLAGYWRHPAILSFSLSPRASLGRQPVAVEGNDYGGNGIAGSASFLGKSRFPLNISYARSWTSTAVLESNDPAQHVNDLSGSQDTFNVSWGAALHRLGNYNVSYSTAGSSAETLLDTGIGDSSQHVRNFQVSGDKKLFTFSLTGDYSNQETTSAVDETSNAVSDKSYGVSAYTPLPLHGAYSMSVRHTRSEYSADQSIGANDGNLAIANLSFTPVSRLTTFVRGTYTTGSVTGQLIGTGQSVTLAGLTNTQQRAVDFGLSFRVGWGTTVFADAQEQRQTIAKSSISLASSSPSFEWRSGISWGRPMLGGDLSASYTRNDDAYTVGTDARETLQVETVTNAANARYRRMIGAGIDFTAGVSLSRSEAGGSGINASSSNSWYASGTHQFRHWKVTARWNSNLSDSSFFNTNTHSRSNMVILTMTSARLSLTVSHVLSGSTGYKFGSQFILVDNAVVASLLPQVTDVDAMSDSVALNYKLGRKMRVTGRWVRANSNSSGSASVNRGYDARWEYWFRLLRFRAGFTRTSLEVGQLSRADTRIYFAVLRPFRVW